MNAQSHLDSVCDPMPAAMVPQRQQAPLHLAPGGAQTVPLAFEGGRWSAEAGVVLRKDIDAPRAFTRTLAAVLADPRDPRRSNFPLEARRKQRVCQMAAGSEDAHDAHTLRDDPLCTLRRDRLPDPGSSWASPPPRSRFANRVSRPALSRMALALLRQWIASSPSAPQVIVLDGDAPEDPVHGGQEPARSASYDGGDCCMPRPVDEGRSGRLLPTMLHAKRLTGAQRRAVLKRLGKRLRQVWPHTLLLVRGARHLASPAVRPWIAAPPSRGSGTGLTSTGVLQAWAREGVAQATRASALRGHKVTRCPSTRSQAGTWSRPRRVVIKVEGAEPGIHTRVGGTDLEQARTQVRSQQISCARGQAENESKAHKLSLQSERTSWQRCEATQWRVLWHAAAYVRRET